MNKTFILSGDGPVKALTAFVQANWKACAAADKPLTVLVSEHRAKRTTVQNKLYWVTLRDIAANAWVNGKQFDDETWHEHFKRLLLGVEEVALPSGEVLTRGISTTTLSIAEMADYIDRVADYAVEELGLEM